MDTCRINLSARATFLSASLALLCLASGKVMGQVHFSHWETYPLGTRLGHVVTGDFDRDGRLDIAAANFDNDCVSVFLAEAEGFAGAVDYPVTPEHVEGPSRLTAADADGDGLLDLCTASYYEREAHLLFGDGAGCFGASTVLSTPYKPAGGTIVTDLNGDPYPDLVVGEEGHVSTFLGTGERNYTLAGTWSLSAYNSRDLASADFDRDGFIDVAVAAREDSCEVFKGNGDGTLAPSEAYAVGSGAETIAVDDFNADGWPDFAVTSCTGGNEVTVYYGHSGGFSGPFHLPTGTDPLGVTCNDFDLDGRLDLVVTNINMHTSASLTVWHGMPDGSFGDRLDIPYEGVGAFPFRSWYVASGDFNRDGGPDLACISIWDEELVVYYNAVPEPATMSLLALGGLAVLRRRKK